MGSHQILLDRAKDQHRIMELKMQIAQLKHEKDLLRSEVASLKRSLEVFQRELERDIK